VWALQNYGFKVVIGSASATSSAATPARQGCWSPSWIPTWSKRCGTTWRPRPGAELTVSLEDKTITAGEALTPSTIDDYTRHRLLNGLDDIGLTLQHEDAIAAYEATRPSWKVRTIPAKVAG
jgi:3-isopropylmalate/(R)-2-methylmalate dehydratase small subunit